MKALVYTDTLEVEYRDEPDPVRGPGEALIEIAGKDAVKRFVRGFRRFVLGFEAGTLGLVRMSLRLRRTP